LEKEPKILAIDNRRSHSFHCHDLERIAAEDLAAVGYSGHLLSGRG
jgi:hypothetical protein